jgi:hypothetical protein
LIDIDYREIDRDIWETELEGFVPRVVHDMHVHVWSEAHKGSLEGPAEGLRMEIDYAAHLQWAEQVFPGREMHFLALGTPIPGMDLEGHNRWMADQFAPDPLSRVNILVTPDMSPDHVAGRARDLNAFGLKPYRLFASDPAECRIADYLPESQIEVADDLGLAVTLHLSKKIGPADEDNLVDLEHYTRRYPRIQWILAHCARGFNAFMLETSIHRLCDMPNIWYDTSAVNDLYAHYLLMKHEDRHRVMFGSDGVVCACMRGKYITYGKAWEAYTGNPDLPHCDPTPTFVIYEQLRQERQVAEMLELNAQEIEDHFSGNAIRFVDTVDRLRGM